MGRGQKLEMKHYQERVMSFFKAADMDGSGTLSKEEFQKHLSCKEGKAFFQALDLDVQQASVLFDVLDADQCNEVTLEEFVEGCFQLRGDARSIDVNMLLLYNRRLSTQLEEVAKKTGGRPRACDSHHDE